MRHRLTTAGVLAGTVVLLIGCLPGSSKPTATAPDVRVSPMPRPATARVEARDIYQTVRLTGVVETYEPVEAKSPVAGRFLPSSRVRNGQSVRREAVIGTVDPCPDPASTGPGPTGGPSPEPTAEPECEGRRRNVRSPAAGVISGLREQDVAVGAAVAAIQPPGHHIRLSVEDPAVLFHFTEPPESGKAEILGGPSGLTVRYEKRVYDRDSGQVSVYVSAPGDVPLFPGLRAVVVFVTSVKDDVLTLPLSAVRGRSGQGEVVTIDEVGKTRRVEVTLGEADDAYVEVSGIESSVEVLRYPLESDFGA
ncbi:efflux RND transporter periplasmic adaptor subunit [Plantactinospora soyae]|uniref:Multidrug efflux pump subunit AcrA (Membrane-fusion protein) n=1 Tax=Plantactinospora soyae TaxID=1544732 RepID=A0A927ME54_9ACTN|nr:efflux RND transporter periplasmic adaptor subunit [Plantactinospora soyae]MBE1489430.1 multidrug efflux pump subunit AcrA (membrane-fusion protein) [Plantactinospora soyae]